MKHLQKFEAYQGDKLRDHLTKQAYQKADYYPFELGEYVWHQTALSNAVLILKEGFKTGMELEKGEGNNAIYFSPTFKSRKEAMYSRGLGGNDKPVMLKVCVAGLHLFDTQDIKFEPGLPSYEQPYYAMKEDVEVNGVPIGYDGIIFRYNVGHEQFDDLPKNVTEIALSKEVANQNLIHGLFNNKGIQIK